MAREVLSVVVVDDADDVRAVVKAQLTLSGRFQVVAEGGTGREAVELASRHQPAVVVLDVSMPDTDGLHAITAIRSASPATMIVMLSGFDSANLRDTAIDLGAADYIEKSAPLRELPARLLELLGTDAHGGVEAPTDDGAGDAAEEVLAAHLERFRTVFDQAAIGMATLTLSGTLVRANRALASLLGGDEHALVGRPLAECAHLADRDAVTQALLDASRGPAAQELEHRLGSGDPPRWAQTSVAAVCDADGRPLYLFAQLEDVTAAHEAREKLRESEERFRLMVESVQDYAIFMLDRDGLVSTWNLGAQRLKGYTADEIIGRHFRTFYPDAARDARHPEYELEEAVRDGRYEEEGWRVRKDGTRFWANVVITALFDRDRHVGFAKVTRDMTERRAAEAQRESAAARLAASNEELHESARQTEEFLAVTAHELQSPIAAITGAAEILLDYWDKLPVDERLDTIKRISAGGDRIRRLLDDLLTASRLEAGKLAVALDRVAGADVIDAAMSEVGSINAPVEGAEGVYVRADSARLVQVLTNLLTNAVKYGEPPYGIDVSVHGDDVEIRVCDKGDGPPESLRPRLFEKFAKATRAQARGTGLGLFIVRELARMQNGDAWYEDGSAFVVRLPRA